MTLLRRLLSFLFFLFILVPISDLCAKFAYYDEKNDYEYTFSGGLRQETFYGHNVELLNGDKLWYNRTITDNAGGVVYGNQTFGHPAAEMFLTLRNKSIWGNPLSIASTTEAEVKTLGAVGKPHKHHIARHFFWMREIWFRFTLNDVFGLPFSNLHTFTLGAFPFQLGRGISLGTAFAIGPEILGFYTDSSIDQFAFGGKFSGELVEKALSYDLYGSILDNKSTKTSEVHAKINSQRFGHLTNPERGFGVVTFILAGRLLWFPLYQDADRSIIIEPYCVYLNNPEQKIEFLGDASTKLATFGVACDYLSDRVEVGFEYAFNRGAQHVHGWDRNVVELQNRNGNAVLVNSHVIQGIDPLSPDAPSNLDPYKALHAPVVVDQEGNLSSVGKQANKIINQRSVEDEQVNGKFIGNVPGLAEDLVPFAPCQGSVADEGGPCDSLYNAKFRYRNPYTNRLRGWMCVADASSWFYDKSIRFAVAVGVASGDENPNFSTQDGDYSGFIGLEEIYTGKRVRSTFLLGGAGKLKRPLSAPTPDLHPDQFSPTISGFTNIIYAGFGGEWIPCKYKKKVSLQPNVLSYWQQTRTKRYRISFESDQPNARCVGKETEECARRYLGTELNLFANVNLLENVKLFCVSSIFIPGGHYTDIKGKPLNAGQLKRLNKLNRTGFNDGRIPNIGDEIAYTCNVGMTFKF